MEFFQKKKRKNAGGICRKKFSLKFGLQKKEKNAEKLSILIFQKNTTKFKKKNAEVVYEKNI